MMDDDLASVLPVDLWTVVMKGGAVLFAAVMVSMASAKFSSSEEDQLDWSHSSHGAHGMFSKPASNTDKSAYLDLILAIETLKNDALTSLVALENSGEQMCDVALRTLGEGKQGLGMNPNRMDGGDDDRDLIAAKEQVVKLIDEYDEVASRKYDVADMPALKDIHDAFTIALPALLQLKHERNARLEENLSIIRGECAA